MTEVEIWAVPPAARHAPPTVTGIEPDPRRPASVRISVDGKLYCTVAADVVAIERLSVGTPIADDLRDRLSRAGDVEGAYRTALRALELRAYARVDLTRRLVRKGHSPEAATAAVEKVAGTGLLDDAAFARDYVQARARRGRGPARLVRELLVMGVERAFVDRAIAEEWPEGADQLAVPRVLAEKRAAQLDALPRDARRRRILAYLARRGFAGREVTMMVREVVR